MLFSVLTSAGCLDSGQIDTTNATLTQNLDEMRKLNKNFVQAADRIDRLGRPIDAVADRFEKLIEIFQRRDEQFTSFVEQGTKASEAALKIMQAFGPEDVKNYQNQLAEVMRSVGEFNRFLAERGDDFDSMVKQFQTGISVATRVGDLLAKLDSEPGVDLAGAAQDTTESVLKLSDATQSVIDGKTDKAWELLRRTDETKAPAQVSLLRQAIQVGSQMNRNVGDLKNLLQSAEGKTLLAQIPSILEISRNFKILAEVYSGVDKKIGAIPGLGYFWKMPD